MMRREYQFQKGMRVRVKSDVGLYSGRVGRIQHMYIYEYDGPCYGHLVADISPDGGNQDDVRTFELDELEPMSDEVGQ